MYEYIKGKISEIGHTFVVIENNGIGYYINISVNSYNLIKDRTLECKIYTHNVIKEDSNSFFGFIDKNERHVFRLLISVSGVGANIARVILSAFSTEEVSLIIKNGDHKTLEKVKGIGSKLAQKIVIELKDKIDIQSLDVSRLENISSYSRSKQESLLALESLGFPKMKIEKIVNDIVKDDDKLSTEDILKLSLKKLTS